MFNKRLLVIVPEAKGAVGKSVFWQEVGLLANIAMIWSFAWIFGLMASRRLGWVELAIAICIGVGAALIRSFSIKKSTSYSFEASSVARKRLRHLVYDKLLRIGTSYNEKVSTAEAVQLASEGVEQLEMYYGAFLPQFFYSMVAPVTLFIVMATVSLKAAIVLLIGVPLIPLSIAAVQKFARKLLSRYWGKYTALGDTFLENLQGLTTLKIYGADQHKHDQMNENAEVFRVATMKVLTMQLNSIIVMDLVAFGGAAIGIMFALYAVQAGSVSLMGGVLILLLAADFFIPMRQLGSFFHVAMNGMAAADKMFRILDMELEEQPSKKPIPTDWSVRAEGIRFGYEEHREILKGVDIDLPEGKVVAIVGESGCGKSTFAGLVNGKLRGYSGEIRVGGLSLREIPDEDISKWITTVAFAGYIFRGSVRENLLMADPQASEEKMQRVLNQVNLLEEIADRGGIDMELENEGSNLSGGQRQRLNLARALMHDSPIYIFDEATSNVDVESEDLILDVIYELAKTKVVMMITHRLFNARRADNIVVLDKGLVAERGTHDQLVQRQGLYARLWSNQEKLENYTHRHQHHGAKGGGAQHQHARGKGHMPWS